MNASNSETSPDQDPEVKQNTIRICPICQTVIEELDATQDCKDCKTTHHKECWEDNSGCGMYGCSNAPETLKWEDHEVPIGYWGQEHKNCPACNSEIKASAIRCKKCGATFQDRAPQGAEEFHKKTKYNSQKDGLQKTLFFILGFSVIPFTAPLSLIFGGLWMLVKRKAIRQLKPFYRAMGTISLLVAFLNILIIAISSYLITNS